ncbi:IQ calmodulin-binding motif family protein [Tritrichomonas foetus]|uniref:non-specific serine/threonine protein kinase n=1 Tax=Tritrichomonas foetus TaxID=1144522 RepID=A0A1J4KVW9_9EUKA|nr:IQ calmodulin-binding motif family protein [Tritrichomonas foetus]|eukprot:OHT13846.1 IQ calmodulin-binding motif family protein [Tritrichomonas foetus]
MNLYADDQVRQQIAATKIQSAFRGYIFRYNQNMRDFHHKNAKIIQKTWRNHRDRQKIQRVIEILALFRLTRAFSRYRIKFHSEKMQRRLHQFDELLGFYPAKTNEPIPKPKPRKRRLRRRGKISKSSTKNSTPRKEPKKPSTGLSNNGPRKPPPEYKIGGVPHNRNFTGLGPKKPARKKKILVDLPPPWHNVNPRRLSQNKMDDMMYDQKENIKWARKELIPLLFRYCNPLFSGRDELKKRNQKFYERIITKNFMCPIPRCTKSVNIRMPKTICFPATNTNFNMTSNDSGNYSGSGRGIGCGVGCVCVIASSIGAVVTEPKTLTADNILSHSIFNDIDSPLLDVAICPLSGQVVGLDSHWILHLFEHERSIMTFKLEVEVTVPKATKFLHFDHFGLLWVNLFPQKGNMLLFDTLTFQPCQLINLDHLSTLHRFMKSVTNLIPLHFKEQPYGFIGAFSDFPELYIFSLDFQKFRKFSHPGLKSTPMIKQANQRVFVWSKEGIIFVYELKEIFEQITRIGIVTMQSPPTDLCATSDPDMIYVACEDYTVHALLGKTSEHPLRLSTARMNVDEVRFCDVLLGPMKFTKSRNQFKEIAVYRFSWLPIKIDAAVFSDKLTMITVAFEDSQVSSIWMVNDAQTCKCCDFDSFNYSKPEVSLTLASSNFSDHVARLQKKRCEYINRLEFLDKFDIKANAALMNNLFNPLKQNFPFAKHFLSQDLKKVFTFIPNHPPKTISAYELYHYLKRIGFLPNIYQTFPSFIEKFAPEELKRSIPQVELVTNPLLPVKTTDFYSALVNVSFDSDKINEVLEIINPFTNLKTDLGIFTFSKTVEEATQKDASRPRVWLSSLKRKILSDRLLKLSILEDTVKTEIMRRIQIEIDASFQKNQLNKMQPVPPIDIQQHAPRNENRTIEFTKKANRNPLLDENRHRCIYDSWSKYFLFGRDNILHMHLRALHVPSKIMGNTSVQNHFELIRKVSYACKKVTSNVHSFNNSLTDENSTVIVISEDIRALPLSHYLTIHSYLGGSARLVSAIRSIFSRVLVGMYQLHKAGIIIRTLYPGNILLNANDLTVKIGNIYDCQQSTINGKCTHLPLPKHFAQDSNPFLPPEYFHEPPRKYTTAFDVWQFGMTLLYVLTGYLPHSYGSVLKKHLKTTNQYIEKKHVRIESRIEDDDFVSDPQIYPKVIFFYDWLKDAPVVMEKDRNIGDRGECYFTTKNPKSKKASILELDHYKLLPYKNTKVNYDEARVFIEIISSCLQIDPEKRPTVEELLKTYPFNQTSQVSDIFDSYMRSPDPNIFVSQFFSPILNSLNEINFRFTMGIISSLMFYEDRAEEDIQYSFPLDTRASESVIASLFQLKFMDKIVSFVLKTISDKITHLDVNPTITFENENFDALHRFFTRFVSNVEKGTGALLGHVDEVIMSLLALYASSPHLRHLSSSLKASPRELFDFTTTDSAAVYVFTYSKLHPLVRYALDASPFIMRSLERSNEHNDQYFNHFISFSETIYLFANTLCSPVEKQRSNLIKTIAGLWSNGQSTSTVRLFLDFKVPQRIISCFHLAPVRNEASSFICSAFRAIKLKSFDPTYIILQNVLCVPTIIHHCSLGIRQVNGSELMRTPALEVVRSILFGESAAAIGSLVTNDILWALVEQAKDSIYYNLVNDAVSFSSVFVLQIIMSSSHLQHTLKKNGIEFMPTLDYRELTETVDVNETIIIAKRLAAQLYIRQSSLPVEIERQVPPVKESADFIIRAIELTLKDCEKLARSIDNQVYNVARFDLKGSTMLKAKSKAKEEKFAKALASVTEICDVLQHLFRCLCFYWRDSDFQLSSTLFEYLKSTISRPIPLCNSLPHPSTKIHHVIQNMIIYCLQNLPNYSPVFPLLNNLNEIWPKVMHRDIMFVMTCVDKDITQMQLMGRYPEERQIRINLLKTMISQEIFGDFGPIFKILVTEMLYNKTEFKFDSTAMLNFTYHFPMRSEALVIIHFLLEFRDKYESASRQLANELTMNNFLVKERKLTEEDDNHFLVNSSILFMQAVSKCYGLFHESIVQESRTLLESLCMRFSRQILNYDLFNDDISKNDEKRKPVQNLNVKDMWQKPLTSLPKTSNATVSVKSARNNRPTTAFASTHKRTIILSKPTTPR